jgi:hypothetical protein
MKTSIKTAAILTVIVGASFAAKAQTSSESSKSTTSSGVILSAGVDAGIPTGNLNKNYNWNIGGSVQADIPVVQRQLFVTINSGYNSIQGKNDAYGAGLSATNIQLLPVKAGLKFFPVSNLYIQGEAGAAFLLNKSDLGFDNSTAFIYAPQIGVQFALSGKSFIDAGVRYEASAKFNSGDDNSKVNFVGLRLAYGFGLK